MFKEYKNPFARLLVSISLLVVWEHSFSLWVVPLFRCLGKASQYRELSNFEPKELSEVYSASIVVLIGKYIFCSTGRPITNLKQYTNK